MRQSSSSPDKVMQADPSARYAERMKRARTGKASFFSPGLDVPGSATKDAPSLAADQENAHPQSSPAPDTPSFSKNPFLLADRAIRSAVKQTPEPESIHSQPRALGVLRDHQSDCARSPHERAVVEEVEWVQEPNVEDEDEPDEEEDFDDEGSCSEADELETGVQIACGSEVIDRPTKAKKKRDAPKKRAKQAAVPSPGGELRFLHDGQAAAELLAAAAHLLPEIDRQLQSVKHSEATAEPLKKVVRRQQQQRAAKRS